MYVINKHDRQFHFSSNRVNFTVEENIQAVFPRALLYLPQSLQIIHTSSLETGYFFFLSIPQISEQIHTLKKSKLRVFP
jgi:16S rRNA G527 N7-methylase RsmG